MLIAHQDEIEANLAAFFTQNQPEVVGNDYLVLGTLDRPDWQKGVEAPLSVQRMLDVLHDDPARVLQAARSFLANG